MTDRDIQLIKVVKAKFEIDTWVIIVIDENDLLYDVRFQGTGEESDSELLENTYNMLLNVDKKKIILPPSDKTRDTVVGLTPTTKE